MSGLASIAEALETRLMAMTGVLPTEFENNAFSPPNGPYQRASFLPATPVNPTFGNGMYREIGTFHILLMYPLNGGSAPAYEMAETIRAWFPRGSSFAKDGVTVRVESTPAIGPGMRDADRFNLPVRVRYFANVF